MKPFEDTVASELTWLLRMGVPPRAIRLTVYELVTKRIESIPPDARDVARAVEDAARAACRLVRALGAPPELVETVCGAALAAVRGHGGESGRWLGDATAAAHDVLAEMTRDHVHVEAWGWIARGLRDR